MIDSSRVHFPKNDKSGSIASVIELEPISIRVSPNSYVSVIFIGTFISSLLFYLQNDFLAIFLLSICWILIPLLALNDRISFDGKRLCRTGLVPGLWNWFKGQRPRLKITQIERVETDAIRALKRGGNIFYRYRTVFRGRGLSVAIASGGDDYRRMIKSILPALDENVLDSRSLELRDHLSDPKETLMRAEFSRIPAPDVLEELLKSPVSRTRTQHVGRESDIAETEADDLRSLANELRLSGYFLQALEAFRRALVLRPSDARLLFEFARCLHSFAGVRRDHRLEHRALAALRLSERKAADDGELLAHLGEWYFQIGEWRRAGNAFETALDRVGESFRTARGLAEIALRDGKIAHVIHHFSTATRVAETPSLRRWSKSETEYFANLNSDDDYMELEISRVNMLDTVERSKKTTLRIVMMAFPLIVVGLIFNEILIANIGWTVSGVAIAIWAILSLGSRMLVRRIPFELIDSEK